MKNITLSKIIGASLLTASFSIQASELNLDDTYQFEGTSAYTLTSTNSQVKHTYVSSNDMYRFEYSGAYIQAPTQLSSGETSEFAVFSTARSRAAGPAIPGYIGIY